MPTFATLISVLTGCVFQAVQLCSELVLCPGGGRGERVQPPVLRVRRPQRHAVQGRARGGAGAPGRGHGGRHQRGRGPGAGPRAGVHRPHQQQGLRQAVRQWR